MRVSSVTFPLTSGLSLSMIVSVGATYETTVPAVSVLDGVDAEVVLPTLPPGAVRFAPKLRTCARACAHFAWCLCVLARHATWRFEWRAAAMLGTPKRSSDALNTANKGRSGRFGGEVHRGRS